MNIRKTDPIVILTGAGISKESGLDTFRDADGIWKKHKIEDVARPEAFAKDPVLVHDFYNQRRRSLDDPAVQPNAAHKALARLEHEWGGPVLLVTQNIDDLHERGGSKNIIHMHGELRKGECIGCRAITPVTGDLSVETPCPACNKKNVMRPHVVWFGEYPLMTADIEHTINKCRLFIAIGTSGTVYPAAGYVRRARERAEAYTIELNLELSAGTDMFHESIQGAATSIVPAFVERLLS